MHKSALAMIFALVSSAVVGSPSAEVDALAAEIERRLQKARYMEGACARVEVSGWEGYETSRCTYVVTNSKTGDRKDGLVVMLNPSARKLSQWIVSACRNVRPGLRLSVCTRKLTKRIFEQSGGQFPVAGIVYEDILPKDGINEAYGFRDGVTTILTNVKHRRTEAFSAQELEYALTAKPLHTASESAFARIVGVTRAEFHAANPTAPVLGLDWLGTVRKEYQGAWNSDRNKLIEAWLSASSP